jgi:sulfonate transport system permease protein
MASAPDESLPFDATEADRLAPQAEVVNGTTSTTTVPVQQRHGGLRRWHIAGLALPVALLALIEVLVRTNVVPDHLLPAPSEIAQTLWQMGAARLGRHIAASTLRVLAGFGIGAALALVLGAAMGSAVVSTPCSSRAFRHCARYRHLRGCRCYCCGWASTKPRKSR